MRCEATTKAGTPCAFRCAPGMAGAFCLNHDPSGAAGRSARASEIARRRRPGGREPLEFELGTRAGIAAALETVLRWMVDQKIGEQRSRLALRVVRQAKVDLDVAERRAENAAKALARPGVTEGLLLKKHHDLYRYASVPPERCPECKALL